MKTFFLLIWFGASSVPDPSDVHRMGPMEESVCRGLEQASASKEMAALVEQYRNRPGVLHVKCESGAQGS